MSKSFFLALLLCGLLAPAVFAQVTLERKIPDGQVTVVSVDVTTDQTLTLLGMPITTKSQKNILVNTNAGKRDKDGNIKLQCKIDSLQLQVIAQGQTVFSFDSAKPGAAPDNPAIKGLHDLMSAESKATWTVTADKANRPAAMEGREKALEGLDAQTQAMMKGLYDSKELIEIAQKEADRIPSKPINKGDSWELVEPMKIDGSQTLTFGRKYTYTGTVEKEGKSLDRIEIKTLTVKLDVAANPNLPFEIKKSELKVAESKGEILFDRTAGRIAEESQKVQIKGELTLVVAGMELPGSLDLTIDSTSIVRR